MIQPEGKGWLSALPRQGARLLLLAIVGFFTVTAVRFMLGKDRSLLDIVVALVGTVSGAALAAVLIWTMWLQRRGAGN